MSFCFMSWRMGIVPFRPWVTLLRADVLRYNIRFSSDSRLLRGGENSQRKHALSVSDTRSQRQRRKSQGADDVSASDLRLQRESAGSQRTSKISASQTRGIREVESSMPENRQYTRRISAAGRERDWRKVLRAFNDAPARNTILYNAAIHAALLCGRLREGAVLFDEMRQEGVRATSPTYVSVIHISARLGRHGEVDELWEQMSSRGLLEGNLPQAYAAMISAKARADKVPAAARYLGELAKRDPSKVDAGHFEAVLHACARARDGAAARRCLQAMRGPGIRRSAMAYASCMRALFGSPLREVQETWDMMMADQVDLNGRLLEAYAEALLGREMQHCFLHGGLRDISEERVDAFRVFLSNANESKPVWTTSLRRIATMLESL